jgi:hypothetical protein
MAAGPAEAVLDWVARTLGTGRPEVVCGLRDGASPWLLRAGGREVVLRVGRPAIRAGDGGGRAATGGRVRRARA